MLYLRCTRKLIDRIGQPTQVVPESTDSLFTWYAHIITIRRRNMLVIMNTSNRFPLIAYGLKKKDFTNVSDLVKSLIEKSFSKLGINPVIKAHYLEEASTVTLLPATDRRSITNLNQAASLLKRIASDSHPDFEFDVSHAETIMQKYIGTIGSEVNIFLDQLLKDLSTRYDTNAVSCRAVSLRVTLELGELSAWRHLIVPEHHTFANLHSTLQKAFSWKDMHLHEFICYKEDRPLLSIVMGLDEFSELARWEQKDEREVLLTDILYKMDKIEYMYDFGDGWIHTIEVLETVEDYDKTHATCIAGGGNAPPEDVGGAPGYKEFLQIINNPEHPKHNSLKHWGIEQGYQEFSIAEINLYLRFL